MFWAIWFYGYDIRSIHKVTAGRRALLRRKYPSLLYFFPFLWFGFGALCVEMRQALLRFHTMKIADINKIIRELWAMTYSGEDIDMIEIVSGDDEDGGKAKR